MTYLWKGSKTPKGKVHGFIVSAFFVKSEAAFDWLSCVLLTTAVSAGNTCKLLGGCSHRWPWATPRLLPDPGIASPTVDGVLGFVSTYHAPLR